MKNYRADAVSLGIIKQDLQKLFYAALQVSGTCNPLTQKISEAIEEANALQAAASDRYNDNN